MGNPNSSKVTQLLNSWNLNLSQICMFNPTTHDASLHPKSFIFYTLPNFLQTPMSIRVYPVITKSFHRGNLLWWIMYKDFGDGKATRRIWDIPKISNCHSRGQRQEVLLSGHQIPSGSKKTRNILTYFFTHVVDWIVSPPNSCSPGTSWCDLTCESNGQCPYWERRRHRDVGERATWRQRQRLERCSCKTGNAEDCQSQSLAQLCQSWERQGSLV